MEAECSKATPYKTSTESEKPLRKLCVKCNLRQSTVLFRRDQTCSECYIEIVERRFKSSLAMCRKNKHETVSHLVAISGGPSSRAMVHLFAQCCSAEARKRVLMSAILVHVNELADGLQERTNVEHLQNLAEQYNYPAYVVGLDYLYSSHSLTKVVDWKPGTPNFKTKTLLELCTTGTAKQDLLEQLKMDTLQQVAAALGCSSILLGTSANRVATLLITNTCLGRFPSTETHIPLHQPMQDFLLKEIALYNKYCKLDWLFVPNLATKQPVKNSIHQLSEAFISSLQSEYSHTVHTLLKSGDKLAAHPAVVDVCMLCSAALPPPNFLLKPDNATEDAQFCYGCSRMLRECKPGASTLLPPKQDIGVVPPDSL